MFDPFTLALIGGAVGGLLDKKDPLRGAALGAAGGYFAPGLLGGAPQAAAPVAEAAITPVAEQAAAPVAEAAIAPVEPLHPFAAQMQQSLNTPAGGLLQSPAPVADAAIKPVSGMSQLMAQAKEVGSTIKPFAQAAGTAAQVSSLFPKDKPIQPSPIQTPMPNSALGNMVSSMQQEQANKLAMEKQARLQRRQMRGLL